MKPAEKNTSPGATFCKRIITGAVMALLICAVNSGPAAAASWKCSIPLEIIKPEKIGDEFPGGWRLESAECSETGVYYYTFSGGSGKKLTLALNLAANAGRNHGAGKKDTVYIDTASGAGGYSHEAAKLAAEIETLAEKWEERGRRANTAAGTLVLALTIFSVMAITYIAEQAKRGRSGVAWNAALAIASLMFAMSAVELGFRSFDVTYKDSGLMAFMADVRDQAALHGGFRRIEKSAPDAAGPGEGINSLGYRGSWSETEKKPGVARIVCAGDSFMYGVGVTSRWSFGSALERALDKKRGGAEIFNYAVGSFSGSDVSSSLLAEAVAARPDIVVYGFVLNDINLGGFLDRNAYFDGVGIRPRSLESFIRSHDLGGLRGYVRTYHFFMSRYEDRMLDRLVTDMYSKSYEPKYNFAGLKRLEKDFSVITDYYTPRGVPVILMIYPMLLKLDKSYPFAATHERVAAMGRKAGMRVIDLLPFYLGKNPETLWVSKTDHHPNREGQRIAAEAAAGFIEKEGLLNSFRRGPGANAPGEKTFPEEEAVSGAKDALRRGDADTALLSIAPALENNPGDCALNELAADIMLARGSSIAVMQKLNRMKAISQSCAARTERLKSGAMKINGGLTLQ